MTQTPINRGLASIITNNDGTKDVVVEATATSATAARRFVTAHHYSRPGVDIGQSVKTVPSGGNVRRTTEAVLVYGVSEDEVVRIRADK
jgi:hypothetical protein